MLKKTLVFFMAGVLLVGFMSFPASAASNNFLDYNDYISNIAVDGDNDLVTITIPLEYSQVFVQESYNGGEFHTVGEAIGGRLDLILHGTEVNSYRVGFYGLSGSNKLIIDDIPNGTTFTQTYSVSALPDSGIVDTPYYGVYSSYFNQSGKYIGEKSESLGRVDWFLPQSVTWVLDKPAGTYAMNSYVYLRELVYSAADVSVEFVMKPLIIQFSISSLYQLQQETKRTNEILDRVEEELKSQGKTLDSVLEQQEQTNEKLDSLPGEIGDKMQGVIDSEKQEASNAGDSAAGELMDIIPNESQGFMDAIQSLVSSMSYNGTEAKLPVPAIKIPAIAGVMDEIKLTDELSVDFGYWVHRMPNGALMLVQILCTIALIVYCFKELYSTIAYAMTLRGGGSSE